jgi:prepilin-type N-terminal cleavage/methylation domain-containing protein
MTLQRGFTLIEMAIVLVIVTILIGGLAMPLSAQIQARRIAETRQTLQAAREALLGYAMTHPATNVPAHHYLPCPDINADGREDRVSDTQCTAYNGLFPWVDLGTAPQDAWGNRLRYAVVRQFIDKLNGFSASNPPASGPPAYGFDPIKICSTHTCPTPLVADNVVFVLVSHGPNGWGANNINGTTLAVPTGPDEADNLDGNPIYISRAPTTADAASGEFDDLAVWVSQSALIASVCPTGCSP